MARKFGKKNVIKVDPLAYNVGLLGESGVGKTTLMVETLDELAGEESYLLLNIGMEDGVDAIPDASYEDIPDFETLVEFVDDVIENRLTDYKDLKVVVVDTMDELFRITEPYIIKLHNKTFRDKPVNTIKAAFGGFQAGEDKVVEEILKKVKALDDVGIKTWFVGHTKRKTNTDVVTGEEYETLTSNMMAKYFNAIKTKLHFLGVASIDRTIEKERIKQKIGIDKVVGKVKGESRIITFRDDNFNIDSKSRFSEITPQIELNSNEFIKALKDAIQAAHSKQKNKKSLEETQVEQEKEKEEVVQKVVEEKIANHVNPELNKKLIEVIKEKFPKSTKEVKLEIKSILEEYGISLNAPDEASTEGLQKVVALLA